MKIPNSLYRYIATQNHNLPLIGAITFTAPKKFLRSIYEHNAEKNLWNGKKACITLSFDCDYQEDVEAIPDIVKKMSAYDYKATFAAVGYWVEKFPKEHEPVLEEGHELMNHTYSHPDNEVINPGRKFRDISIEEKTLEVTQCHEICERILGCAPTGFRVPHFKNLFTPEIYGILSELGYKYSSSTWLTNTTSYGLPFEAEKGIIEFPLSTCPKHPFTVFDTWHSLNAMRLSHRLLHRGPQQYLQLFKELITMAKATGSYMNIYMDPLDVKNIPGFDEILDILSDDEIDVVTYEEYLSRHMHVAEVK